MNTKIDDCTEMKVKARVFFEVFNILCGNNCGNYMLTYFTAKLLI